MERKHTKDLLKPGGYQDDKAIAIVIAGESGSGKTVTSTVMAQECGYDVLYCMVPKKSTESKPKGDFEYGGIRGKLQSQLCLLPSGDESIASRFIHDVLSDLCWERNEWAKKTLELALENAVKGCSTAWPWLKDKTPIPSSWRPENVAIVLDEVTDLDLLKGLISIIRETRSKYKLRLARRDLQILLVGTGTDLVSLDESQSIGTDPSKVRLISMEKPDLDKLLEQKKITGAVFEAVKEGLFSSVLSENARMLFPSIIPILQLPVHKEDDGALDESQKDERLRERLKEIASYGYLMDYAVRRYVNQNAASASERSALLSTSFQYHLHSALRDADSKHEEVCNERDAQLEELGFDPTAKHVEALFTRGFATKSVGTSRALKYLASFGLTTRVRRTFGADFEELTLSHYMRRCEVEGFVVSRVDLKYPWPPAGRNFTKVKIEEKKEEWKTRVDELADFEFRDKHCYLFLQGTRNAQGPDIYALKIDGERAELVILQSKNVASLSGIDKKASAWASLGVDFRIENVTTQVDGMKVSKEVVKGDLTPYTWKAGYSYEGIESFRKLLERRIGNTVILTKRIVVCSFPMSECPELFVISDCDECQVWFREMLEPTISIFPVAEPVGKYLDLRESIC